MSEIITASLTVSGGDTITVNLNTLARGPAGTGGSGSNSVTSATTSDGTANLSISNVTTATATVSGTLTANHIHGNLAGSVYAHVRAGEALAKGDPVYVSGSHGSGSTLIAIVSKADASNAAKMPAVGIMDADLANNATGHMVIVGTITELATNTYTVNAELYVASGGGMTATPPTARAQPVARVERSNLNNGAILVKVNGLSASDNTPSTLVRRTANGDASFSAVDVSTLTASGISTTGQVEFNGTTAGDSLTFNMVNYTYGTGAAAAHRTALGATATGTALFTAASASAARTTLELEAFSTNGSITGTGALTFTAGGSNQNITITPSGSGVVTISSASAFLNISTSAGAFGGFRLQESGSDRWTFAKNDSVDDLIISRFNTSGVFQNNPFAISTATGVVSMAGTTASTSTTTGALVVSGGVGIAGAVNSLYQRVGSGTPEGVVTAPVGAVFHRTNGGAGTSFYVKESGTGNTGWVAK